MIQTAQNFSYPARELLASNQIHVDRWKCAWDDEWIADAAKTRPVYVHFPFNTHRAGLEDVDWGVVKDVMAATQTPYVNIHLVAFPEEFPEENPDAEVLDSFVRCLSGLAEIFGADKVIGENVVARANGKLSRVSAVRPELISEALERVGCGLLLDTAHLGITCKEQNWNPLEALDAMPLTRMKELHVTGSAEKNGIIMDSMPMTFEDWNLPRKVINKVREGTVPAPWLCALEYGGIGEIFEWRSDPDVMVRDNHEMSCLLASIHQT